MHLTAKIPTKLESGTHKCQVSSIWGLRATKFGNVGVRLPGVWVSPGKCLRKTPPKGHVYSAVGLGFIVWDTMLGLPGANLRHQTTGWVCPLLASSQSARMLSTHMHTLRRRGRRTCILLTCTYTLCMMHHCLIWVSWVGKMGVSCLVGTLIKSWQTIF